MREKQTVRIVVLNGKECLEVVGDQEEADNLSELPEF